MKFDLWFAKLAKILSSFGEDNDIDASYVRPLFAKGWTPSKAANWLMS